MYCKACGRPNNIGAEFCVKCGTRLGDATPPYKKRKRLKPVHAVIGAVMIAGIAAAAVFVGAPMIRYGNAADLEESGKYAEAAGAFAQLGDYKDARERVGAAISKQVESLLKSGEYEEAAGAFAQLGDDKDARERVGETVSKQVESLLKSGEYEEAGTAVEKFSSDTGITETLAKYQPYIFGAGDDIMFGGCEWLALERQKNQALLISKDILDVQAYHEDYHDITWENCGLRQWLNGYFYNKFDAADRERILDANTKSAYSAPVGGNETGDRFFLLSIDETVQYFGDSGGLAQGNADNAWVIDDEYNDARMAYYQGAFEWWWLRSPGESGNYAAYVNYDGGIELYGCSFSDRGGVRPALWLDFEFEY
jgi:hypothetical protein